MRHLPLIAALAVVLGGCKLIDQRTFEKTPAAPDAAALNRPVLPPLPLLTLRMTDQSADWRTPVDDAVRAALLRKPDVAFSVLTPIPTSASRAVQDKFAKDGAGDAQMVGQAIQADGIPPERVTLGFQGDPGSPSREVRIFAH